MPQYQHSLGTFKSQHVIQKYKYVEEDPGVKFDMNYQKRLTNKYFNDVQVKFVG